MPSKIGNWTIGAGTLTASVGLLVMAASFSGGGDHSLLEIGMAVFSFGLLAAAAGLFLNASALKWKPGSLGQKESGPGSSRPVRGGCDRCQVEMPVVQCKVHQQQLCGTCLAEHYDFRSCVYAPSPRRGSSAKAMAAKAR